jgi:hypothetical protein
MPRRFDSFSPTSPQGRGPLLGPNSTRTVSTGPRPTPSFGLAMICEQACQAAPHLLGLQAWDPAPQEHFPQVFALFRYCIPNSNLLGRRALVPGCHGGCAFGRTGRLSARVGGSLYTGTPRGCVSTVYGLYMDCIWTVYGCIWDVCVVYGSACVYMDCIRTVDACIWTVWALYALCVPVCGCV